MRQSFSPSLRRFVLLLCNSIKMQYETARCGKQSLEHPDADHVRRRIGAAMLLQAQMTEKIVKTQYLACNSERQFFCAERLRTPGDGTGLQAFSKGALLAGTCSSPESSAADFETPRGEEGIIRIRPKGSFGILFTSEMAFD
jgi:hypothetical protein